MKAKSESEVAQSCLTLSNPHGLQLTRLLRPWDFPGKGTGVTGEGNLTLSSGFRNFPLSVLTMA